MQKISILCPSSILKDKSVQGLINDYSKRITAKIDFIELNTKTHQNDSAEKVKTIQGESILSHLNKLSQNTVIIAMDERGQMIDSPTLAEKINQLQLDGYSSFCFIIGGAYGLSEDVLSKVDFKLSFGKMVWPHRLVSVMLLEQLYRAQQINAGHPYHKD